VIFVHPSPRHHYSLLFQATWQ